MSPLGTLSIKDRVFTIVQAEVEYSYGSWSIEIETEDRELDGELWGPRLYHQGLSLSARRPSELEGTSTSWETARTEDGYPHPELGIMYVFGHHPIERAKVSFGALKGDLVEVTWEGWCDVFWDEPYHKGVPFRCECRAVVKTA